MSLELMPVEYSGVSSMVPFAEQSIEPWEQEWQRVGHFFNTDHACFAKRYFRCLHDHTLESHEKAAAFFTLRDLACNGFKSAFTLEQREGNYHFSLQDSTDAVILGAEFVLLWQPDTESNCVDEFDAGFELAEDFGTQYPAHNKDVLPLDHISRLVIFGDSLSDSEGRMYHKSHDIFPSAAQYYQGRFTNGFTWADFVSSAEFLNIPMVNYAEGGSTSADYGWLTGLFTHLINMFQWFFSSFDKQISHHQGKEQDLTIVSLGSNDYMTFYKEDVNTVIENQLDNSKKLLAEGVRNIVFFGVPDLSLTPYARQLKHGAEQERLWKVSRQHNQQLKTRVCELQASYPDATIKFFDVSEAFTNVLIAAERHGYNLTDAFNTHGYINLFEKKHDIDIGPKYIFNDDVHPTQEVHFVLALMVDKFIRDNFAQKRQPIVAA